MKMSVKPVLRMCVDWSLQAWDLSDATWFTF